MAAIKLSHMNARANDSFLHKDDNDIELVGKYSPAQNKDEAEYPPMPLDGANDETVYENVSSIPKQNGESRITSGLYVPMHGTESTDDEALYENNSPVPRNDSKELTDITAHSDEYVRVVDDGEGYEIPKRKDKLRRTQVNACSYVPVQTNDNDDGLYDSVSVANSETISMIDNSLHTKNRADNKVQLPVKSKVRLRSRLVLCVVIGVFVSTLISILSAVIVYYSINSKIEANDRQRLTQHVQDLRREDVQTEEINALRNDLSKVNDKLKKLIRRLKIKRIRVPVADNITDGDAILMVSTTPNNLTA